MDDPEALAAAIADRDRYAIARALNLTDDVRPKTRPGRLRLLEALRERSPAQTQIIGMTGPPGVGKSTLTARLVEAYIHRGLSVGVLAVDPSSKRSGGALLGDRIRLQLPADDRVFVRSLATREHLGGLSRSTYPAKLILAAAFDRVVIETVGVGQSETEVRDAVDLVALILQPASGDTIQFLKAGVMEIPELLVLNKADLAESRQTLRELRAALRTTGDQADGFVPTLVSVSAREGSGIDELYTALDHRFDQLAAAGTLAARRHAGWWRHWLALELLRDYGQRGLAALGGTATLTEAPDRFTTPFAAYQHYADLLEQRLRTAAPATGAAS